MKTPVINKGLRELPGDNRDMPLGGVFGFVDINDVPNEDFFVSRPIRIKDQGDSDLCSAFAVTSVSEDQEGVLLLPEYQFYATKRITGQPEEWGADLRSACKSAVKYGSVAADDFPEMIGRPRDFILDEKNWRYGADHLASFHKKETYFAVTGKYDTFDNIRAALWQHREGKNSIVTGASWKNDWITAENGIITEAQGDGFGHAFKIFGQKVINGELFLVAQLSNGTEIGDGGLFYFNRKMANLELPRFGIYMFKDISREEAEYYLKQPFTKQTPGIIKVLHLIINFFKK